MTFQVNNQFWRARSKHGADAIMKDAQTLYEACVEYFEWIEENPLIEEKVGFSKGRTCRADMNKVRAMTASGLSLFLGITHKTWIEWKKTRDDLKPIIEWAETVIWNQKFSAAAAGLLNANIISRELGLADKQVVDVTAPRMTINPPAGEAPDQPPIHGE